VPDFDVFVSYAHNDREQVAELRDALVARGLEVWLDDLGIETFESITAAIENGLACSKALLALYSRTYPQRRACLWELTAAFLAAQRDGGDPRSRVLVVNPEDGVDHVKPVELRDARFAPAPPGDRDALARLAGQVAAHVAGLDGVLGELGVGVHPPWYGQRPIAAARFVGRVTDMWEVHSRLTEGKVGLITGASGDPAVKVMGMGGIGKSLLASEYALRYAAAYPGGVFWLYAHGHDDIGRALTDQEREDDRNIQLRRFAAALGVDTTDLPPAQLPAALARTLDERAQPFLWIADDLPGGLGRSAFDGWCAPGRYGRTLVTTRSRAYRAIGGQIDLGVLSTDEGVELLAKHTSAQGPDEQHAARGLVEDLGGHALAVDVAGAALAAEHGLRGCADYRTSLSDPHRDELEFAKEFADELPSGHEASITTTLARSIDLLHDTGRDFLRLASRLAVQPIPAQLVIDTFMLADGLDEVAARRRAVTAMHDAAILSLADAAEDGARPVHTLISRTMRVLDTQSGRADKLEGAAIDVLKQALTALVNRRVSADSVTLAHARHLATPPHHVRQAELLNAVAVHHLLGGDFRSARPLLEQARDASRDLLGAEHPDTLTAMNNLAEALNAQGHRQAARTLHERTLDARYRTFGHTHPDTVSSMNNLAESLCDDGDLRGARYLQERVLDILRRQRGDEHRDTLVTMNNLATTLRALGDLAKARALHEQTLEARRRVQGDEHPDTLSSMNNLARTLYDQGDLEGARALQEQVLAARRRVFGPEHPSTLRVMNNLAITLRHQGDVERARVLHEQALEGHRRALGDEHPDTLGVMTNLAITLRHHGDVKGARALHEQALEARWRMLGDGASHTLSESDLAAMLFAHGDRLDSHARPAKRKKLLPNMRRKTNRRSR
jgi:tetratricopeptide (TPR) repeat protein